MAKTKVLLEFQTRAPEAFNMFAAALDSESEAESQTETLFSDLAGIGIDIDEEAVPVPMFGDLPETSLVELAAFSSSEESPDSEARSSVVACEIDKGGLAALADRPGVTVWPNSQITLFQSDSDPIDAADSEGGTDCRPFRPAVEIAILRRLLGVEKIWSDGYRGQNIIVGIIDEGVNDGEYPVVGGFSRPNAGRRPGAAPIDSHGSMCAADVLVSAPAARIYDYPFLGVPRSGGALQMFQAVLDQRRRDGTPHLTTNSYGFVGVPDANRFPNHEVHDTNHPVHRKVREVVGSGAPAFFAAGNCGQDCPSGRCQASGIGPGRSIHASNSLEEVISVAAVNAEHDRIGYSSQGPGMFFPQKPDVASYSHFFGNFGPGRPAGGGVGDFDNGTSAATPVAAGVGALLLSAFPNLTPQELKDTLVAEAASIGTGLGWNRDYGHGVISAAATYNALRNAP